MLLSIIIVLLIIIVNYFNNILIGYVIITNNSQFHLVSTLYQPHTPSMYLHFQSTI